MQVRVATDKNRVEYEQRVNRVLDYIREHRAEELTLETLALVAAFSPFHFHRVFKSITGENLKEHVQRTRSRRRPASSRRDPAPTSSRSPSTTGSTRRARLLAPSRSGSG